MSNKINYFSIEVPEDTDPKDYTWRERRAEMLEKVFEEGHPRFLSQNDLAERYDVTQSQISQDFTEMNESVKQYMDRRADLKFLTVYDTVIEELRDDDDKAELRRWLKDFKEFLMERGKMEKEPDKHEIEKSERLTVNIVPTAEED